MCVGLFFFIHSHLTWQKSYLTGVEMHFKKGNNWSWAQFKSTRHISSQICLGLHCLQMFNITNGVLDFINVNNVFLFLFCWKNYPFPLRSITNFWAREKKEEKQEEEKRKSKQPCDISFKNFEPVLCKLIYGRGKKEIFLFTFFSTSPFLTLILV